MKQGIILLSLLLILSGCSIGRTIDTSTDYSSNLKDGTYSATSTYNDSYGFKKTLRISVHSGIISEVSFVETSNGIERQNQSGVLVQWQGCDLDYSQIVTNLYQQTIMTQGSQIDTITGATKTCEDYSKLLKAVYQAAEKGMPQEQNINNFNDIYVAINNPDPYTGSQEELTVTINNGEIVSVNIREVTNNAAYYILSRNYLQLAEISSKTKSLENVELPGADSQVLSRYNDLLAQVREMREK